MLEAGEGSEEIDEGFLQVTSYNFKQGKEPKSVNAVSNASQDFMQMPHEGDESDSSSEMDDGRGNKMR